MQDGYRLVQIGAEKEPVLIIDDFSSQLTLLRSQAQSAQFEAAASGYPGVRAPVSPEYLGERREIIGQVLREHFGFQHSARIEGCDYSLVTTPPAELKPFQRIPHYDATDGSLLALLHYLNCPDDGGTAFYRHKATGFETITPERERPYKQALAREMSELHLQAPSYLNGDSEHFEKIGEVAAIPNRMVIYRGRTLHSGCIRPGSALSSDPQHGRLTVNTFMTAMY